MAERVTVGRARNGRGLFAARAFRTGETVMQIEGRVVAADLLWDRGGTFADNCYRYGPETYLDPGDGPARFVNHSCAPNVRVFKDNRRLYFGALEPIRRGAELVFDYSTTLGDDDIWTMRCNCGTRVCRKRVRRVGLLPDDVFERYLEREAIPQYILKTLGWMDE